MDPAASPSRASRRMFVACLALAGIVGIAALFRSIRDGAGDESSPPPSIAAGKHGPRLKATNELKVTAAIPGDTAAATPAAALPGHEGHGDECAQCLAERKLVDYREDFALLHFSRVRDEFELDETRSGEVLDACRRFARSVLTEWSFSDKKPRLPEDAALEARRREILGPLLGTLPRKPGDTL